MGNVIAGVVVAIAGVLGGWLVARETLKIARDLVAKASEEVAQARTWATKEIAAAREEVAQAQRLLESRNLAEFTSAEEQLMRVRRPSADPKPREDGALDEMWRSPPKPATGKGA